MAYKFAYVIFFVYLCSQKLQRQLNRITKLWLNLLPQHQLLPVRMPSSSLKGLMLLFRLFHMKIILHALLLIR